MARRVNAGSVSSAFMMLMARLLVRFATGLELVWAALTVHFVRSLTDCSERNRNGATVAIH